MIDDTYKSQSFTTLFIEKELTLKEIQKTKKDIQSIQHIYDTVIQYKMKCGQHINYNDTTIFISRIQNEYKTIENKNLKTSYYIKNNYIVNLNPINGSNVNLYYENKIIDGIYKDGHVIRKNGDKICVISPYDIINSDVTLREVKLYNISMFKKDLPKKVIARYKRQVDCYPGIIDIIDEENGNVHIKYNDGDTSWVPPHYVYDIKDCKKKNLNRKCINCNALHKCDNKYCYCIKEMVPIVFKKL
jgi:hypothetical protein